MDFQQTVEKPVRKRSGRLVEHSKRGHAEMGSLEFCPGPIQEIVAAEATNSELLCNMLHHSILWLLTGDSCG